jgi:hypothetical protein
LSGSNHGLSEKLSWYLTGRTEKTHEKNVIQDSNGSNQATPKYKSRAFAWPTGKKSNNFKYENQLNYL